MAADSASRIPFWACAHRTWSGPHVSFKQNTIPSRHTNGWAAVGSGSALRSAGTAPIQHAAGVALGMATGYLPQRIPCEMVSNAVHYPMQHGIRELDGVVRSAVDVQVRRGGAERRVRVHELQPSTAQSPSRNECRCKRTGTRQLGHRPEGAYDHVMPSEWREWCVEEAAALPPADDQPHRSVALLIAREQDDLQTPSRGGTAHRESRSRTRLSRGFGLGGWIRMAMSPPEYASLEGRSRSVLGPPAAARTRTHARPSRLRARMRRSAPARNSARPMHPTCPSAMRCYDVGSSFPTQLSRPCSPLSNRSRSPRS